MNENHKSIFEKALENLNHPLLSEITRRTTYRGHSPGVKPTTGIKLNLPKTSTMAAKMERVLADKSPEGRKRMKQMNNLVIGREEDGDKISLEFKTTASRERFRKMMNELSENVQLDENVQNQVKRMDKRAKEKLAKQLNDLDLSGYGDYEARIDNVHKFKPSDLKMAMQMMSESFSMSLEERAMTYVIDRKTKKIVHGPTDTGDAKLYVKKQIQPRKFMIRQIRGAAKKVGDSV